VVLDTVAIRGGLFGVQIRHRTQKIIYNALAPWEVCLQDRETEARMHLQQEAVFAVVIMIRRPQQARQMKLTFFI
jgi:hypothetical protein